MRITPCHIGCISPRRQARERRSLQTSKRLCGREANIGLTLHTDFVDPVVSARVSTVGIYAVCSALSPEEPRHYNQHTNENYRSTKP